MLWQGSFWFPKCCRRFGKQISFSCTFQRHRIHLSLVSLPMFHSLEQRNLTLETEMLSLHDELDQERKKFTMIEIKMRNAERAKEDAEKRNDMLQKEMEQFFSTFGDLTVEPRRSERGNTIWIQWALLNCPGPLQGGHWELGVKQYGGTVWVQVAGLCRASSREEISFTDITIHIYSVYQSSVTLHNATVKCYNWICV